MVYISPFVIPLLTATEKYKAIIMFGPLPIGKGELAFFPSHLRNTIMEADITMLQVNYNGTVRLVMYGSSSPFPSNNSARCTPKKCIHRILQGSRESE